VSQNWRRPAADVRGAPKAGGATRACRRVGREEVLLIPEQRAVGLLLEHAHDAVALARAVGCFHDDTVRAVPIEIAASVSGLSAVALRLLDLSGRQESWKGIARKVDRRAVRPVY